MITTNIILSMSVSSDIITVVVLIENLIESLIENNREWYWMMELNITT